MIDQVVYPVQYTDITYGRLPNVTGPFNYLQPTFGEQNDALAGIEKVNSDENTMVIYPNPASDVLNIKVDKYFAGELKISDLQGRIVYNKQVSINGITQIEIDYLAKGTYIVQLGNELSQKLMVH